MASLVQEELSRGGEHRTYFGALKIAEELWNKGGRSSVVAGVQELQNEERLFPFICYDRLRKLQVA